MIPINPLNGHLIPLLLWAVNGLLAFVTVLLGVIIKEHRKQTAKDRTVDNERHDENRRRMEAEILALRQRVHEQVDKLATATARLRWLDEGAGERRREPRG